VESDELEDQLDQFEFQVNRHGVEDAERILRQIRPEKAEEIIKEFRERIGKPLRDHHGLLSQDHKAWYLPKSDVQSPRWAYAKSRLGLPPEALDETSRAADEILARLSNPHDDEITTRGLVLGHVQSGKTTSFLSVAAKAADNGFDLIIILAGVHNSLRRQTQDRAVRTLVHRPRLWWLGTEVGDFKADGNPLASHLAGEGKCGLLVVKKHSTILKRLADWLEDGRQTDLRKLAVLVIDDEADQAGLNVASNSDRLEGVHKQLHRIVNLRTADGKRRCAYLAYTATPYANILTSQDEYGLYPMDFIYPLDRPKGYVGSLELFGGQKIGKPIQIELDNSARALPQGLQDAIRWFILATSARASLEKGLDKFHSSMLIHITQSTEEQIALRPLVEQFLSKLRLEFEQSETEMQMHYFSVLQQVPAREGGGEGFVDERVAPWSDVREVIPTVLDRLIHRTPAGEPFMEDGHRQWPHSGVIVDNSKVSWEDRLTYSDLASGQPGVTVIAIGGNTLSRGLTLEGLTCSYFARVSPNYDSLMQMARWFGYRPGYRHLIRIWTTQVLFDWFRELDQVEQDLRAELQWMQESGKSPSEYGPRIRVSPNMNITRAAAMKSVSRSISYSDTRVDLAWLRLDRPALEANQELARRLAGIVGQRDSQVSPSALFRSVQLDVVWDFLAGYSYHPQEKRLDLPSLENYLNEESSKLSQWSVLFKSLTNSASTHDFGGQVGTVNTVSRAREDGPSIAFIGSVVDPSDFRIDVGELSHFSGAKYRASEEPPLLVIYTIDPQSPPRSGESGRVALAAELAPISFGLALPRSTSTVQYVSPNIRVVDMGSSVDDCGDFDEI